MKILIVEDELISRNLLKKMLDEMGHTVLAAEDGSEAWELFQQNEVQIIIADWMMPNMDGLELCRRVRSLDREHYVYIIILTAKDDRDDLLEVFNAGADDYITKPFDPEELQARIKTSERVVSLEDKYQVLHETLVESREELQLIFDALDEEIVAIDNRFNIIAANEPFSRSGKLDGKDMLHRSLFDGDHELNRSPLKSAISDNVRRVFEEGKSRYHDAGSADDNTRRNVAFLPVKTAVGKVIQVVVVIRSAPD